MAKPLYQQIAEDLREQIEDGRLPAGAQLPTQEQLAEKWLTPRGVSIKSRGTIRRALEELVNEGLVISRRPVGVFVRNRKRIVIRPQDEFGREFAALTDFFTRTVTAHQGQPSQQIKVEFVRPPAAVAERLRTEDEVVVVRARVRSVDGERYDLNDSYYPKSVVEGSAAIMSPDDVVRGVNRVLDELGYRQALLIDEYVARMPTSAEVQRLDLPAGTPVLEQVVTGYLGDEPTSRPVRCVVTALAGDRHRVLYERRRPPEEDVPTA